jgi:hypothetical protein
MKIDNTLVYRLLEKYEAINTSIDISAYDKCVIMFHLRYLIEGKFLDGCECTPSGAQFAHYHAWGLTGRGHDRLERMRN